METIIDFLVKNWERIISNWILHAFLVVLCTLILNKLVRKVLHKLEQRAIASTKTLWDEAVINAAQAPLSLFIWVSGIGLAAAVVGAATGAELFSAVGVVRDLVGIVSMAWFLVRLVDNGRDAIIEKRRESGESVDLATITTITKLLRISVIITATLVVMEALGFSISGLLAFGGIGGIAVGFAAKDLLANFFGGMMIFLDRPFSVGDWIYSPDKEIEGVVEDISWRLTRIRTFDKRPLYIPNAAFSTISVVNPSRMTHRRIYETIGIRYEDAGKMEAVVRDVKKMLLKHPEIDSSQTLIVNFNSFAPSSLDFFVYTFTHTREWVKFHEIKQDVLLRILRIIEGLGAEVAFPTSTVHIDPGTEREPPGAAAGELARGPGLAAESLPAGKKNLSPAKKEGSAAKAARRPASKKADTGAAGTEKKARTARKAKSG
ncbi:MAG: mechanosensitive ion channel family protein [Deltaproteobacteria bacterium]|nr:mechanosensitive ion channel family protein [Deltaproteobacteria bacterium]